MVPLEGQPPRDYGRCGPHAAVVAAALGYGTLRTEARRVAPERSVALIQGSIDVDFQSGPCEVRTTSCATIAGSRSKPPSERPQQAFDALDVGRKRCSVSADQSTSPTPAVRPTGMHAGGVSERLARVGPRRPPLARGDVPKRSGRADDCRRRSANISRPANRCYNTALLA